MINFLITVILSFIAIGLAIKLWPITLGLLALGVIVVLGLALFIGLAVAPGTVLLFGSIITGGLLLRSFVNRHRWLLKKLF